MWCVVVEWRLCGWILTVLPGEACEEHPAYGHPVGVEGHVHNGPHQTQYCRLGQEHGEAVVQVLLQSEQQPAHTTITQ